MEESKIKVPWSTRLQHLTWANWTLPMSTGGLALLLGSTPHQFTGLNTIGKVVFIWDLTVYLAVVAGLSYRFITRPGSLKQSLLHPTESLFFGTFLLATVNALDCAVVYGEPATGAWFTVALRVIFWIYVAFSFLAAVLQYYSLFSLTQRLTIQSMTPAWILPALSAMLTGTLASMISSSQSTDHRMSILIAGLSLQGFGFIVSLLMYALFINRLMQYGLPAPNLRPGMYIAVGPPSFTALALIGMSNNIPTDADYFAEHPLAPEILRVIALFVAIFLWTFAFFFFCIATVALLAGLRKMSFHLIWWSLVFPNVGFTIATTNIGRGLGSEGILWVASAMTILLVVVYLIVLGAHIRAIWTQGIYMPGKDEDKDEYKLDDEMHGIFMDKRM